MVPLIELTRLLRLPAAVMFAGETAMLIWSLIAALSQALACVTSSRLAQVSFTHSLLDKTLNRTCCNARPLLRLLLTFM